MTNEVTTQPLTANAFKLFGEIIDTSGDPDKIINQGMCGRYHDLAQLDFTTGQAGISIFDAKARSLPFSLEMMERHPEGSQTFMPMHQNPFLIIVAHDKNGMPDTPISFISKSGQGINIYRNTWHGVLCPLHSPGLFTVIDRIGIGPNLEEHWFRKAWTII